MWFSSVLKSWQLSEFDLSKLLTGRIFSTRFSFPVYLTWGFSICCFSGLYPGIHKNWEIPGHSAQTGSFSPKSSSHATRLEWPTALFFLLQKEKGGSLLRHVWESTAVLRSLSTAPVWSPRKEAIWCQHCWDFPLWQKYCNRSACNLQKPDYLYLTVEVGRYYYSVYTSLSQKYAGDEKLFSPANRNIGAIFLPNYGCRRMSIAEIGWMMV